MEGGLAYAKAQTVVCRILVAGNASAITVLPQAALSGCRFHLGQSCSGVECSRSVSVKTIKQMNTESPDLNPATTDGCESYHAHINADSYSDRR